MDELILIIDEYETIFKDIVQMSFLWLQIIQWLQNKIKFVFVMISKSCVKGSLLQSVEELKIVFFLLTSMGILTTGCKWNIYNPIPMKSHRKIYFK